MNAAQELKKIMLGTAALLVVSAMSLVLWWPNSLPAAKTLRSQTDRWVLTSAVSIESDAALSAINQAKLWGGPGPTAAAPAPADEPPLTPPDWRITGVVSERGKTLALLSIEGQKPPVQQELRVGDKLPGGAKILAITPERICILLDGKKRSISTLRE